MSVRPSSTPSSLLRPRKILTGAMSRFAGNETAELASDLGGLPSLLVLLYACVLSFRQSIYSILLIINRFILPVQWLG
jgi:hypothetical protein